MKGKMTAILASTVGMMLTVTGFILPASAKIVPTITATMRNTPKPSSVTPSERRAAHNIIGRVDYHDLGGGARSNVENMDGVRVDRQGQTTNGDQNIQVQLNGRTGASTVAAVLIPGHLLRDSGHGHQAADRNRARHREVERNVRRALQESLNSYLSNRPAIYTLTGTPSNGGLQRRDLNRKRGIVCKPYGNKGGQACSRQ